MDVTRITQSLLKAMFFKGQARDYCPRKIYHQYFLRQKVEETTDSQMKGIYFERKALGGETVCLPTKRNGEVRIETLRIDRQLENFRLLQQQHLMQLHPLINTQVTLKKRYSFEYMLEGTLDWFPTLFLNQDKLQLCIVDLKLTRDLNNTFSEFSWGKPESMDLIQANFYCNLIQEFDPDINTHLQEPTIALINRFISDIQSGDFSFYFLVFDYKEPPEYRFIEIPWNNTAKKSLFQSIERAITEIELNMSLGWCVNPGTGNCKRCLLPCSERFTEDKTDAKTIIQLTSS